MTKVDKEQIKSAKKFRSVAEEFSYISMLKCSCGSRFKVESHKLRIVDFHHYSEVVLSCLSCKSSKKIYFDVEEYYRTAPLGVWR